MLTLESILKTTRQMTAYGEFDRTTRRPDAREKQTSQVGAGLTVPDEKKDEKR